MSILTHHMKRGLRHFLGSFIVYGCSAPCVAIENLDVAGLFGNKAVLVIDGKRYTLEVGESSPEGVKLVKTSLESAVLEIDGATKEYLMGKTTVGTHFESTKQKTVQVFKDSRGMYRANGVINGHPVEFLVDTGATSVAMNTLQAKRLGIQYMLEGEKGHVSTASGVAQAYYIKLNVVSIGSIKLHNIDAVVLEGAGPVEILLGMSFLSRLKVEHKGQVMWLTPLY